MSWAAGLLGGVMIGLGAVVMMGVAGRIAGISGVVGGVLAPVRGDVLWRLVFIAGLLGGAALAAAIIPGRFEAAGISGVPLVLAGLLVGAGATLANGCTSGHGVCGLARLSGRSAVAVITFMLTATFTVWMVRHGF